MNDQLKRIREKDYSKIDQKLFENIARTDNLSSTLSHLSEFQQFLIEQINGLNNPNKNNHISHSISKNFQNLKESLVKCSRAINHVDRKSVDSLKKNIKTMEQMIRTVKIELSEKIADICKNTKQEAEHAMGQLINLYQKQKNKRLELEQKCQWLEQERQKLLQENTKLTYSKYKSQNLNIVVTPAIVNSENQCFMPISIFPSKEIGNYQQIEQVTPLRQNRFSFNTNTQNEEASAKGWKAAKERAVLALEEEPNRSRPSSNHKLSKKQNLTVVRERELLMGKGVQLERGRSRQKIKVFSMI